MGCFEPKGATSGEASRAGAYYRLGEVRDEERPNGSEPNFSQRPGAVQRASRRVATLQWAKGGFQQWAEVVKARRGWDMVATAHA